MSRVRINPAILRWAQERAGISDDQLAKKFGVKSLQAWHAGSEQPTLNQAQALARALLIPFGYLFLSAPPETTLPVADFRHLPEAELGKFSLNLQDVLNDALRKRDWFREWRVQEGSEPQPFIGRFSPKDDPNQIAADIRQELSLPQPTAKDARSWDDHLRFLVRSVEQKGILVLQNGVVYNNTKRTLAVEEFRGFTLADEYAPLIFINGRDSVAARIFTLAHELGHLWTGTSGISNPDPARLDGPGSISIERLCNQIAAELLVPRDSLRQIWVPGQDLFAAGQKLARHFRVSAFVILIRCFELGLVSREDFENAYAQTRTEAKERQSEKQEDEGGGGDFYKNVLSRNSRLLVREVTSALSEGQLLYQEAAQLLNLHPKKLTDAIEHWR